MKKIILSIFLLILGVALFSLTLRGGYGNPESTFELNRLSVESFPFESSHERAPYAEMLAIKNRGTIELGKELAIFASPDVGYRLDKYYSFFPSGVAYTALAFYTVGALFNLGQIAAYFSSSVFSILTMVLIYLITTQIFKRQNWAGLLASLTYAFATISWSYSITIYQHAAAAFFAVFLFYSSWKYKQTKESWLSWVWASLFWIGLGLALFYDYPNAIILFPLCVYFFVNSFSTSETKTLSKISFHIPFLITSLFFVGLIVLNAGRNLQHFGSWSTFGNSLPRLTKETNAQQSAKFNHTELANKTEVGKNNTSILKEENSALSGATLLFGIDKGLFLFSPILLLAIVGVITSLRVRTMENSTALGVILSNLFVYISFSDPWGGWAYGPRYLVPLMTFASIFVLIWVSSKGFSILKKIIFFVIYAISSAIALAGPLTTNLIPPKVEADFLKIPFYNFLRAFDLLSKNQTGNFIYNTYLRNSITLYDYYFSIWGSLLGIVAIILFVAPIFEKNHESEI